jgi:hypothetical protein
MRIDGGTRSGFKPTAAQRVSTRGLMTRHERLSLGISIAALVIAIVSPFLNYYWFQNEVRVRQLKSEAFVVEANEYDCANLQTLIFDLELKNTGVWPIEHVQLNIPKVLVTFDPHTPGKILKFLLNKRDIKPEPPLAIEIEDKSKAVVVRFKDALPPNSDVALGSFQVRNVPSDQIDVFTDMEGLLPLPVWVSSEVSSFFVEWSFKDNGCSIVEQLRRASSPR